MMKALGTIAFGALALVVANFASAAPAKADSFGFHVGNGGFGIYVNDYGYRDHRYRRCWDRYYGRYVRCRYYNNYYPGYYGYYDNYPRHRWGHRGHRGHYNNNWRGRHDGWRGGRRGGNDGWRGGSRGGRDGWRGGRNRGHDGDRGRRGNRGRH